jgi:hypothetical protein
MRRSNAQSTGRTLVKVRQTRIWQNDGKTLVKWRAEEWRRARHLSRKQPPAQPGGSPPMRWPIPRRRSASHSTARRMGKPPGWFWSYTWKRHREGNAARRGLGLWLGGPHAIGRSEARILWVEFVCIK